MHVHTHTHIHREREREKEREKERERERVYIPLNSERGWYWSFSTSNLSKMIQSLSGSQFDIQIKIFEEWWNLVFCKRFWIDWVEYF